MQPKSQSRPVMDVTARRPVAPATRPSAPSPTEALAVHAAPATEAHGAAPAPADQTKTVPQKAAAQGPPPEAKREQPVEKPAPAASQPSGSQSTAPVGVIICTILAMAGLSALAIAIYASQK